MIVRDASHLLFSLVQLKVSNFVWNFDSLLSGRISSHKDETGAVSQTKTLICVNICGLCWYVSMLLAYTVDHSSANAIKA